MAWSATPTALTADAELTLTLTVSGVANPHRVRRPDLAAMPAFKTRFQVVTPTGESIVTADAVTFTYRLRPRDESVGQIPELEYRYYKPGASKLPTRYLDAIPLQVRPAAVVEPATPIIAPERFFELPPPATRPADPSAQHWAGLLAGLGVVVAAAVGLWRLRYPDGPRLARLRRNRAVRRVLESLDRAASTRDPAGHAAAALRRYFVERYGLFANPTSPGEIEAALQGVDFPPERTAAAVELLRKVDAARFGGGSDNGLSLVAQARKLVLRWEGGA